MKSDITARIREILNDYEGGKSDESVDYSAQQITQLLEEVCKEVIGSNTGYVEQEKFVNVNGDANSAVIACKNAVNARLDQQRQHLTKLLTKGKGKA